MEAAAIPLPSSPLFTTPPTSPPPKAPLSPPAQDPPAQEPPLLVDVSDQSEGDTASPSAVHDVAQLASPTLVQVREEGEVKLVDLREAQSEPQQGELVELVEVVEVVELVGAVEAVEVTEVVEVVKVVESHRSDLQELVASVNFTPEHIEPHKPNSTPEKLDQPVVANIKAEESVAHEAKDDAHETSALSLPTNGVSVVAGPSLQPVEQVDPVSNPTPPLAQNGASRDEHLQECLDEVNELEGLWDGYREASAVFGGRMEEVIFRITNSLQNHQRASVSAAPSHLHSPLHLDSPSRQELSQQVVRLIRDNQLLSSRVARAEGVAHAAEAMAARKDQEIQRLNAERATLQEEHRAQSHATRKEALTKLVARLTGEDGRHTEPANETIEKMNEKITSLDNELQQSKEKNRRITDQLEDVTSKLTTAEEEKTQLNEKVKKGKIATKTLMKRYIELEDDANQWCEEVKAAREGDGNGFILVLVEAEARMFDPRQLRGGEEGGAAAIAAIRRETERLFNLVHAPEKEVPIIIYLYFDISKTIDELKQKGVIKDPKEFDAFMEGFSSADDHLTISDVTGNWGASIKIRAQMTTLGRFSTCKMILLIAGQDRKYLETVNRLGEVHRDKLYAARSTGPMQHKDDPFRALGDDRLFYIDCLFPTMLHEWNAKRIEPQVTATQVGSQQTGTPRLMKGYPPLQPNPALVPNPVLHRHQHEHHHDNGSTSSAPQNRVGSPLLFSPMPTGEPQYRRVEQQSYQSLRSQAPSTHISSSVDVTPTGSPRQAQVQADRDRGVRPQHTARPSTEHSPVTQTRPPNPFRPQNTPASTPPTSAPPRPSRQSLAGRIRIGQGSIGGSPPSSVEDEPLLRHVQPASRTYVIRPPAFTDEDRGSFSTATPPARWGGGAGIARSPESLGPSPFRSLQRAREETSTAKVTSWRQSGVGETSQY